MYKKFYVPILKWKRGEQKALEYLDDSIKDKIVPLLELPPIAYITIDDLPSKSIDEHLDGTGEQIKQSLGNRPFFIDLLWLEDFDSMKNGQPPLEFLIDDFINKDLNPIIVTGTNRIDSYNESIYKLLNKYKDINVCIRIEDDDFFDIEDNIKEIMKEINASENRTHLIIDLKYIRNNINSLLLSIPTVINSIPNINEWLSLSICGTSFPENLSMIEKDSIESIDRVFWKLWNKLISKPKLLNRLPQFGDYAIAHPDIKDIDPRLMNMSGNIRYTSSDKYVIFKGHSTKKGKKYKDGWTQMFTLTEKLINHNCYCGKYFSYGDNYIYECAKEKKSTGSAETWRRAATNHHLTFVTVQLSNLSYF